MLRGHLPRAEGHSQLTTRGGGLPQAEEDHPPLAEGHRPAHYPWWGTTARGGPQHAEDHLTRRKTTAHGGGPSPLSGGGPSPLSAGTRPAHYTWWRITAQGGGPLHVEEDHPMWRRITSPERKDTVELTAQGGGPRPLSGRTHSAHRRRRITSHGGGAPHTEEEHLTPRRTTTHGEGSPHMEEDNLP